MTHAEIQTYLKVTRSLTPVTIKEFNISFCDKQGYLYAPTTYPKIFTQLPQTYFLSLVFPIYDVYNVPIGFMTRRMYPSKSKYVNSSNNNVFTKGKHLYGLHASYSHILAADQVIVVEGLFDFLQLYQSGVKNVVATMGTALTDTHIALLSRFTQNVVVLPDPDKAGDKFGKRSIHNAGKYVNCRYVKLPTAEDPDEFIIKNGKDIFMRHLDTSGA